MNAKRIEKLGKLIAAGLVSAALFAAVTPKAMHTVHADNIDATLTSIKSYANSHTPQQLKADGWDDYNGTWLNNAEYGEPGSPLRTINPLYALKANGYIGNDYNWTGTNLEKWLYNKNWGYHGSVSDGLPSPSDQNMEDINQFGGLDNYAADDIVAYDKLTLPQFYKLNKLGFLKNPVSETFTPKYYANFYHYKPSKNSFILYHSTKGDEDYGDNGKALLKGKARRRFERIFDKSNRYGVKYIKNFYSFGKKAAYRSLVDKNEMTLSDFYYIMNHINGTKKIQFINGLKHSLSLNKGREDEFDDDAILGLKSVIKHGLRHTTYRPRKVRTKRIKRTNRKHTNRKSSKRINRKHNRKNIKRNRKVRKHNKRHAKKYRVHHYPKY